LQSSLGKIFKQIWRLPDFLTKVTYSMLHQKLSWVSSRSNSKNLRSSMEKSM
jgi:hypothetical protein